MNLKVYDNNKSFELMDIDDTPRNYDYTIRSLFEEDDFCISVDGTEVYKGKKIEPTPEGKRRYYTICTEGEDASWFDDRWKYIEYELERLDQEKDKLRCWLEPVYLDVYPYSVDFLNLQTDIDEHYICSTFAEVKEIIKKRGNEIANLIVFEDKEIIYQEPLVEEINKFTNRGYYFESLYPNCSYDSDYIEYDDHTSISKDLNKIREVALYLYEEGESESITVEVGEFYESD